MVKKSKVFIFLIVHLIKKGDGFMATIKCPNCGNEISKDTELCVYCRHDLTQYNKYQLDYFEQQKSDDFFNVNGKSFTYKDYSIMKARMASITCPIVCVIMDIGIIIIAIMFKEPLVLLCLIIKGVPTFKYESSKPLASLPNIRE